MDRRTLSYYAGITKAALAFPPMQQQVEQGAHHSGPPPRHPMANHQPPPHGGPQHQLPPQHHPMAGGSGQEPPDFGGSVGSGASEMGMGSSTSGGHDGSSMPMDDGSMPPHGAGGMDQDQIPMEVIEIAEALLKENPDAQPEELLQAAMQIYDQSQSAADDGGDMSDRPTTPTDDNPQGGSMPPTHNPNDPTGVKAKSHLMQRLVQRQMGPQSPTPDAEGVHGGEMKQAMLSKVSHETAGFMAAALHHFSSGGGMEKTAEQISGRGRGMASAIDAIIKGANHYSFSELMNVMADSGRIDDPEKVRRMGRR